MNANGATSSVLSSPEIRRVAGGLMEQQIEASYASTALQRPPSPERKSDIGLQEDGKGRLKTLA
jgi:hypothetical protein